VVWNEIHYAKSGVPRQAVDVSGACYSFRYLRLCLGP
jgi:hypothetical protein